MDEATKRAIEGASEQAAAGAVEAIKPYFDAKVDEVKHHFDVSKEQIISEIRALGEGEKLQDEKLDEHASRIERLEDHAGLPALEPVIDG